MATPRALLACALFGAAALAACGSPPETGGVTARIVWPTAPDAPGVSRRGLRSAAVPGGVGRLVISVLHTDGSTLGQAILSSSPGAGEQPLDPAGGTWTIEQIPVGIDRTLVVQAFFSATVADETMRGRLAFRGVRRRIHVRSAVTENVGEVFLETVEGARVPLLDLQPPEPPSGVSVQPVAEGEAVTVDWTAPADADVAGYVVAWTSSVSTGATPILTRGATVAEGDALLPGYRVVRVLRAAAPETVRIQRLANDRPVRVFVYAFDQDLAGRPLNFSSPSARDAVPADSAAPAGARALSITSSTAEYATIAFVSPGEDADSGTPARYEIRVALDAATLMDPARFVDLPTIVPPRPRAGGMMVSFDRSFAELGTTGTDPFFLGVRAIDAAGNLGPIVVEAYTLPAMITPTITEIVPPIAIAGETVELRGALFGADAGELVLDQDADEMPRSRMLAASVWTNERIVFQVPDAARSGRLTVRRAVGGGEVASYLSVLARVQGEVQPATPPFEALGAPGDGSGPVNALYSARQGGGFEAAIERLFGGDNEGTRTAPFVTASPLIAVGGGFNPQRDRFLFVASSRDEGFLTGALASSARAAPAGQRINEIAQIAAADGIGIEVLDGVGTSVPAVLVASAGGRVQVGFTADVRIQRFDNLTTITSSVVVAEYATVGRREDGGVFQYLVAYREGGPLRGQLVLQSANGTGTGPRGFTRSQFPTRPAMGERVRILDVPGEGFVLAYEERQLGGRIDVRLLRASDYGIGPGLAPFPETRLNRRLEDVGLVTRAGVPHIAIATTRVAAGNRLFYAEVPIDALARDARGAFGQVELDAQDEVAGDPLPQARLGCKPVASLECPLVWLGRARPALVYQRR